MTQFFYRLFSHAALALSCACLLQAEQQFLPAPDVAIPPVVFVIFVAFLAEGRWTIPDRAANACGLLIAGGGIWWMIHQVYSPSGPVVLPLPTGLVPHLGPIVMALLLVKLFRPRRPADFWVLQGLGLLQVSLACVLTAEPRFGVLCAGYVALGTAALALRHTCELAAPAPELRGHGVASPPAALQVPAGPFLRRPVLWTAFVGLVGSLLFLATPRGNWQAWDPLTRFGIRGSSFRASTGFTEEINLNRTGALDLDDEVAFTVTAVDGEGRPFELKPDQRWRGAVLEMYRDGYWSASERARAASPLRRQRSGQDRLPNLGPDQYFLDFKIQPRRAGGLFLADPILMGSGDTRLPVTARGSGPPAPFFEFSGTVIPAARVTRQDFEYRQVNAPAPVPDLVNAENLIFREYALMLLAQPPERIATWTKGVLERLAADRRYGLTPADLDLDVTQANDTAVPIPRSAERIARALSAYLAEPPPLGDFGYTLDQRREDVDADPAVDFLCNVRAGHCERFASGLTLMLRGCGIPARVVKGYRGAEGQGGAYVIRQCDAHAWVEALVPRLSPRRAAQIWGLAGTPRVNLFLAAALAVRSKEVACDWLLLDPTPQTEKLRDQEMSLWQWCQIQWHRADLLWRDLVLDFNADQQADLWSALTSRRGAGRARALLRLVVLGVVAAGVMWLAVRLARLARHCWRALRARAARAAHRAPPAWLARLYRLLARHFGIRPEPGQTPRETAAVAAEALRRLPAAARFADLPGRVVDLFYRVRFGDRPLDDAERRGVDDDLNQLALALRAATAGP
jgi:hypothetical protein